MFAPFVSVYGSIPQHEDLLLAPASAAIASSVEAATHDAEYHAKACASGAAYDRVVTGWGAGWSACSTTCGQGTATRDRTVIHEACNGGVELALHQERECLTKVCTCTKVECKYEAHACSTYDDAVAHEYHSSTRLWDGITSTANVAGAVTGLGSNHHYGFVSKYDNYAHTDLANLADCAGPKCGLTNAFSKACGNSCISRNNVCSKPAVCSFLQRLTKRLF